MELMDFLNGDGKNQKEKFLRIFRDMNSESSPKLLKQLTDRIRKQKKRLNHTRSREAALKDKLSGVMEAISIAKEINLSGDTISVLEGWRDELLEMLDKVECKKVEDKVSDLVKIRDRIGKRSPFLELVLGVLEDGSTES